MLGEVDDTPKITGVQPNVGDVGTMVSISGSNFTGATEVSIGNTQIQNFEVAQGGNTITFTVPESATVENFTGRFTVVTPEGTVTSAENVIFTFQEVVLSITAVNPAMGGVGTTVTISGTKFAGATSLMIGDTEIQEFDVNEAGNAITFTVPETATSENFSGRFTVVAPGGEVTSAENIMFTFGEVSNVVVYLPFDGDAEDASGNENDATLVDGGTFEDGVVGEALVFNGENHVLFPTGILSTLEEMTISTYVQLSESTVWVRLFDFGSSQDVYAFLPAQGPDGDIRFVLKNSGAEEILMPATTGDGTLVVGEWYHIAVTLKEGVGILYLNGVEIGKKDDFTIKPSDLGETTQNYIGKSQYPDPLLKAMVDEFRIYNEALTPEQIEELASDLQ